MPSKYTPRLSVEITEEQMLALQQLCERGLQKVIFGVLVDEVIRLLKLDKPTFIAAIFTKKLTLDQMLEMKNGNPS